MDKELKQRAGVIRKVDTGGSAKNASNYYSHKYNDDFNSLLRSLRNMTEII